MDPRLLDEFEGEVLPTSYKMRSKEQLRQAQMIYQMADTALNPRKTIGELIGRPVQFYMGLTGKQKRRRVEHLLEEIALRLSSGEGCNSPCPHRLSRRRLH